MSLTHTLDYMTPIIAITKKIINQSIDDKIFELTVYTISLHYDIVMV